MQFTPGHAILVCTVIGGVFLGGSCRTTDSRVRLLMLLACNVIFWFLVYDPGQPFNAVSGYASLGVITLFIATVVSALRGPKLQSCQCRCRCQLSSGESGGPVVCRR